MKLILAVIFAFTFKIIPAQSKPAEWFTGDTSSFKIYKKVRNLDKAFLAAIETERKEICSSESNFRKGCIGPRKSIKLNWIAKDKENHQIEN